MLIVISNSTGGTRCINSLYNVAVAVMMFKNLQWLYIERKKVHMFYHGYFVMLSLN
jgi:hypothetical protein